MCSQKALQAKSNQALDIPALNDGKVHGWLHAGSSVPLFIEAYQGAFDSLQTALVWVEKNRTVLDRLILDHGGIVLRGLPIASAQDFNQIIELFPRYEGGYAGGATPRNKVYGQVMESTRLEASLKITLHSEMSYLRSYPPRIAFFCKTPAPVGGETIIGSNRAFTERLPLELRTKLERLGGRTVMNFAPKGSSKDLKIIEHPDQRSWDDAFMTDSVAEVEEICSARHMTPTWNMDGSLTLTADTSIFTVHPVTGEAFYRSTVHANGSFGEIGVKIAATQIQPSGWYLGDGTIMSLEDAALIKDIYEEVEQAWHWLAGDLMILDNLQSLHGRNPFSGPREVLVGLLA